MGPLSIAVACTSRAGLVAVYLGSLYLERRWSLARLSRAGRADGITGAGINSSDGGILGTDLARIRILLARSWFG